MNFHKITCESVSLATIDVASKFLSSIRNGVKHINVDTSESLIEYDKSQESLVYTRILSPELGSLMAEMYKELSRLQQHSMHSTFFALKYSYFINIPLNDSMTLKGGVYIASPDLDRGNGTTIRGGGTGDDFILLNETIYVLEATFKF